MACEIKFKGQSYTREEFDNIPLSEKIEVVLNSPYLQQYLDLGYKQLSQDGRVFSETPVAQEEYKEALNGFQKVKQHAENIIGKIIEIFSRTEEGKKVDAALVVLDTLAQAWSERTGRPKEYYYQRYLDVKQSTVEELGGEDVLYQVIGTIGTYGLDVTTEGNYTFLQRLRAIELEKELGVTKSDWVDREMKLKEKRQIKILTGWERNAKGEWVYEIADGNLKPYDVNDGDTTLSSIYEDELLFKAYPKLKGVEVIFFDDSKYANANAYVQGDKLYINKNTYENNENTRATIAHEISHLIADIEGFERGGNPKWFEGSIKRISDYVRGITDGSNLTNADRSLQRQSELLFGDDFFNNEWSPSEQRALAFNFYQRLQGEVTARNIEKRINYSETERANSLLSETEEFSRRTQLQNRYKSVQAQIVGEKGVVNLEDSVNRLQNLQLAKRMLSESAPMGVIKLLTGWEQNDGVWKTETDDSWNFTVKRMPNDGKSTTVGELIGDAEVLNAYPQLKDVTINFNTFSTYFAAAYQPSENTITINKKYVDGLQGLKKSLVHELQHAVQEIEGWQQGTNPTDTGSQEKYRNAVGEVEARNASNRINLTETDKLETLLDDTADVSPEDRVHMDIVSDLVAEVAVWHGSPHNFDRFSTDAIGTGEGAQAFGWGLYFTDLESIARSYADTLGGKPKILYQGKDINTIPEFGDIFYYLDPNNSGFISYFNISQVKKMLDLVEEMANSFLNSNYNKEDIYEKSYEEESKNVLKYVSDIKKNIDDLSMLRGRNLYKTTLYKGKQPSEYTWLEWDKPLTNEQKELLFNSVSDSSLRGEIHNIKISDRFDADSFDGGLTYRVGDTTKMGQSDEFTNTVYNTLEEAEKEARRLNFLESNISGKDLYESLAKEIGQKQASLFLLENGIDGIKYPAESISRGVTSDDARGFNYVVFDGNAVTVEEKILFKKDMTVDGLLGETSPTDLVHRAAVEFKSETQAVLHALESPNISSLVHEFAHMFEQDLDASDMETLERWSGFKQGSTEFRESIAEGFEAFLAEDHPELSAINQVFAKIAKWLSNLYKSITTSPLERELNDDVRMVFAKVMGVEQAFSKRLNRNRDVILNMSNQERLDLLKKVKSVKKYMPSTLPFGTHVVKKNGSIGIVGREDLSGTTAREKQDGVGDVLSYPLVSDLANYYEKSQKLTIAGKKSITPSCT